MEFSRGIDRFIELHGDLDVVQINRGHVRKFRDEGSLFQSFGQARLEKPVCQNLRSGRASIPVRRASVQPLSTNG